MNSAVALILAGGFSSRMQGFMPLLPLPAPEGTQSALGWLAHTYKTAGVSRIVVVCGHWAEDVDAEARHLALPLAYLLALPQPYACCTHLDDV